MTFNQYKFLALKVFPNLPDIFEQMPDDVNIHQLVIDYCEKYKSAQNVVMLFDYYSIKHMAEIQLYHLEKFKKTYWHDGKKK